MAAEIVRRRREVHGRPANELASLRSGRGRVGARGDRHSGAGPGRRRPEIPLAHLRRVRRDHRRHDVRHLSRRQAGQERRRFLCGGRRRVRTAEWLGDRRRLPVGGVVPRHRRPDLALRLRRLHVLGRLAGRLHHRAAGDRRAVSQHRQIHAVRHSRLSQQSAGGADRRRAVDDHGVDVLPDRADGRRRRAGEDADRHRLRNLGDGRRRADARLRAVRRDGGDDLGADHQGDPAGDGVDPAGDARLGAVRLQSARLPHRRDRRCQGAGAGCNAAR